MTATRIHDPSVLRSVFGAFPTGVTAIASVVDGKPIGIAASSFTSVSLNPPLVSVCMAHSSTTWPSLSRAPRLGVSVLGADQEGVARRLASREPDRFASLSWTSTNDGAVLLDQAAAWLECTIERQVEAGDHDIVLLRVVTLDVDHDVSPLVFHGSRFRRLES